VAVGCGVEAVGEGCVACGVVAVCVVETAGGVVVAGCGVGVGAGVVAVAVACGVVCVGVGVAVSAPICTVSGCPPGAAALSWTGLLYLNL